MQFIVNSSGALLNSTHLGPIWNDELDNMKHIFIQ